MTDKTNTPGAVPADALFTGTWCSAAPAMTPEIVIHGLRITKDGITYNGQEIEDAGAVHAALMDVLKGKLLPAAQATPTSIDLDPAELDKLEALAREAMPGPWMRLFGERTVYDRMEDGCRGRVIVRADLGYSSDDARNLDFIAAANPATMLQLIALARRAHTSAAPAGEVKLGAYGKLIDWNPNGPDLFDLPVGTKLYLAAPVHDAAAPSAQGIYVASRASVPARPQMWQSLRAQGWPITSTWIDEAGEGQTADMGELWQRIHDEIASSCGVILYAEESDFPLKGAFIECGMAIGMGKPVAVVLKFPLMDRAMKPLGSWGNHPLVKICQSLDQARRYVLSAGAAAKSEQAPTGYIADDARGMLAAGRSITVHVSTGKVGPWCVPIHLAAPSASAAGAGSAQPAPDERALFDAWNVSLGQESFGIRSVPNLPPAAWAAWQARAALSVPSGGSTQATSAGDVDEREAFEAWHRSKFATKHCTGQPTRDMHNGIYAEQYGPKHQQLMWEAWQAASGNRTAAQGPVGQGDAA